MKTKTIAVILFILYLLILFYISANWYKFNKNMEEHGGEMVDGIFEVGLIIVTIYYSIMTVWSYVLLRERNRTYLELGVNFTLGILTMVFIIFKIYF